jgi:peptide/nickel transport system permease protein
MTTPQYELDVERPKSVETSLEEERIAVATQWQLMWWRFRKHKLALISAFLLVFLYIVVLGGEFFAYADPTATEAYNAFIPPWPVHFFDEGRFNPHVCAAEGYRDEMFNKRYREDCSKKAPVRFFTKGFEYKFLWMYRTNLHLIGVEDAEAEDVLFILGTDSLGRDIFSRLVMGTRISLTLGLVGVVLSLFLGVLLGGFSGLYGGTVDTIIQRIIEILRSLPTIPLWMGLSAAMPIEWGVEARYFAISVILSIFGWTGVGRVVRGRFLSLREEDFIIAAELAGCSQTRIIFRHMLPSFTSHLITQITLNIPRMIIAETALSFLGVGMKPPAISWGVLLQAAQNVQSIANTPWMLLPAVAVIVTIIAFSFLGDGVRDAADPYSV